MPATVIVGLQWGDEGKGKTTDFLAEQIAMVVRYQGGDNAGPHRRPRRRGLQAPADAVGRALPAHHVGHRQRRRRQPGHAHRRVRHARPSAASTSRGVRVSRSAHVIMPYHLALDRANEARLAGAKVGTTGRGIGPAYGDRAWRLGLRMEDLLDAPSCASGSSACCPTRTCCSRRWAPSRSRSTRSSSEALGWGERLRDHLDDTTWLVQAALARGEHVLLEGAQGTLLDLDHGSYPFVTSSNPVAGGACTGGGIGPLQVDEVIGVMKAYSTRVGSGPYPTELLDGIGAGHRRARPRVRDRHRPAAPGRLVRRRPAALRGRGQQRQLDHAQQARHPVRHRHAARLRRLRDRRPAGRDAGRRAAPRSRARRRSTTSSRAGPSRSTASARSPTCPRTRAAT